MPEPQATPGSRLHDAGKRLFVEQTKIWAERAIESPEGVTLAVSLMDGAYDLVVLSARKGGTLSNKDVAAFMQARLSTFGRLSQSSIAQCSVALLDLIATATSYSRVNAVPWVGYAVYGSFLALDSLTLAGECYLMSQDLQIEAKLRDMEKELNDRRAWAKSNAGLAARSPTKMANDFKDMLRWNDRQPRQCTMPSTSSQPQFRLP